MAIRTIQVDCALFDRLTGSDNELHRPVHDSQNTFLALEDL
jgi:hypothetical protein